MGRETKILLLAWLALLALLALTAASSFLPLGAWNSVLNFAIALAKALLVALVFMRLARAGPLPRMVLLTSLATLAILFALSGADYATRRVFAAPWSAPRAGQTQGSGEN
jgi:cytochrome c oxidase subunit IV